MSAHRIRGLTLLEMLVVLIIAAMAITLGFQSLEQWGRADAAVSAFTQQGRQARLLQNWTQASIRALHPVEERPFAGDAASWSGVTLQPVFELQGGATEVRWQIIQDGDAVALGIEESGTVTRVPLQGVSAAGFEYVDRSGAVYTQWPPALGLHDQLPSSVVLRLKDASGGQRLWGAGVAGIRNPVLVIYESEQD